MVKFILIKSPDEWATTKQACREELVVHLSFSSTYIYIYIYIYIGRRGGLMVSALDSGSSGPGSGPGRGHCVVFLGKTLYSHGASLHPGV